MKNRDGTGSYPDASWTTDYHTGAEVNVYAAGYRVEDFAGITDNTEIHDVLASF
jgi:alkaline phosphatase